MKFKLIIAVCLVAQLVQADTAIGNFPTLVIDGQPPLVLGDDAVSLGKDHHPNPLKVGFTQDGRPLVSAHRLEVEPGVLAFDYRMQDRFGPSVDRNNNGIPDIPNSRDYVHNLITAGGFANQGDGCQPLAATDEGPPEPRFSVLFNTVGTVEPEARFVRRSISEIREEVRTKLGDDNIHPIPSVIDTKTDTEKFRGTFVLDERTELGLSLAYRWVMTRIGSSEPPVIANGPSPRLCLAEGSYDVTLSVGFGNAKTVLQRRIVIEDHLIVVMGDSFAAGEGSPEGIASAVSGQRVSKDGKPRKITSDAGLQSLAMDVALYPSDWADAGIRPPRRVMPRTVEDEDSEETWSGQVLDYNVGDLGRRDLEHIAAHRSSFSAGAQLAAAVEAADPRSSVTFINVAATGARIDKGLLEAYVGTKHEVFPFGTLTPPMAPQVNQVEDLVDGRQIDTVLLSVGGNDMGFARLIAAGFVFERELVSNNGFDIEFIGDERLNASFETGDWGWMTVAGNPVEGFIWGEVLKDDSDKLPGLNGMEEAYDRLNKRFKAWETKELLAGGITLVAPPFFGSARRSAIENPAALIGEIVRSPGSDPVLYCRVRIEPGDEINGLDEIDPRTFKLIAERHYTRMFDTMKQGAEDNRWTFVDQGKTPENHGMCAHGPVAETDFPFAQPIAPLNEDQVLEFGLKRAWYNSPQQGYLLQRNKGSENTGMFHPNAIGNAYAAWKMLEFGPDLGVEMVQGWWNDEDDTIAEAVQWVPNKERSDRLERVGDVDVVHITVPVGVPLKLDVRGPVHAVVLEENGNTLAATDGRLPKGKFTSRIGDAQLVQTGAFTVPVGRTKPNPFSGVATAKVYIAVAQRSNVIHDPVLGTRDNSHGFGEAQQRATFGYALNLAIQ